MNAKVQIYQPFIRLHETPKISSQSSKKLFENIEFSKERKIIIGNKNDELPKEKSEMDLRFYSKKQSRNDISNYTQYTNYFNTQIHGINLLSTNELKSKNPLDLFKTMGIIPQVKNNQEIMNLPLQLLHRKQNSVFSLKNSIKLGKLNLQEFKSRKLKELYLKHQSLLDELKSNNNLIKLIKNLSQFLVDLSLILPDLQNIIKAYVEKLDMIIFKNQHIQIFNNYNNNNKYNFPQCPEFLINNYSSCRNILNTNPILIKNYSPNISKDNLKLIKTTSFVNQISNINKNKTIPYLKSLKRTNKNSITERNINCQQIGNVEKNHLVKYPSQKLISVPKLKLEKLKPTNSDFNQEFLSKIDEFSDSWRQLAKNMK